MHYDDNDDKDNTIKYGYNIVPNQQSKNESKLVSKQELMKNKHTPEIQGYTNSHSITIRHVAVATCDMIGVYSCLAHSDKARYSVLLSMAAANCLIGGRD